MSSADLEQRRYYGNCQEHFYRWSETRELWRCDWWVTVDIAERGWWLGVVVGEW